MLEQENVSKQNFKQKIEIHNGKPAIVIDGKPYPPMMATIRTNNRTEMVIDKEYYRELGKAGVKIFFLICDTVWLKPNAIELFRQEAEMLLEVVPDAYIVARIGMHPTNEWIKAHPAETLTYSDGSRPGVHLFTESYETDLPALYSLCSTEWRRDAGKALEETWNILMSLPYADRIIGCFFAAGGTSEWYYLLRVVNPQGDAADHSESFKRQFTRYLTEKYSSDEALQNAWKDNSVTLANPKIPEAEAHYFSGPIDHDAAEDRRLLSNAPVPVMMGNGTNIGSFIDVDKRMDVFDFYRAWHNGTADSILHFANVIKTLTPEKLTGAFYGSFGCTDYLKDGTSGGVVRILQSDKIDFLAAPGVYENRGPGGFVGQREMFDSFALNNKIYIIEDDSRTHLENRYFRAKYDHYDLQDSVNIMKREFGRTICEDVQAWWFDQLLGGKRFKHPEIYKLIKRQQEIAHEAYAKDRTSASEIAFIFDEESAQVVSQQTTKDLVELMRNYEIARIGAPVDQYYHNDMANPDMPSYKMYIFFNTFVLTDDERRIIHEKLKKDNAVAVWMYASGVINPDTEPKFSVENIKQLTGINSAMINDCYDAKFRINGEESAFTNELDRHYIFGTLDRKRNLVIGYQNDLNWDTYLWPLFYTDDEAATVAAKFLTSEVPAITVKECDGFTSVFYGSKHIRSNVMKNFAKAAGVHIYAEDDDVIFANRNYVTYHASTTGKKTVKLPKKCDVFEVYEGKYYAKCVTEFTFEAYLGETKMFCLE